MSLMAGLGWVFWGLRLFRLSRAAPERVRAAQEQRFRSLLRHAADRSPFYREKYWGIDLDRCPLSDLPTTNKAELMADFDRVVTDTTIRRRDLEQFVDDPANVGRLFQDKFMVCHTSGSQGQPMLVVQDQAALDVLFICLMTRGNPDFARYGVLESVRRVYAPARIAILISRPGFFPSAWFWKHLPGPLQRYVKLLYLQANDPDVVDKLNDFRPGLLISTPTTLDLLALKSDKLRLDSLRRVATNSETLTDAARARLSAAYRVPVMDTYGAGECLFLTNGCHVEPGSHVNADWAILEVVDEDNRPVAPGQLGEKVLVTNLANTTQPLIRYEIRDRLMMAATPCKCGSRLPRIERVLGRAADFFWVRSGPGYRPLSAYPFQHAFEHFRELREWRATQIDRNQFRVQLEPLPGAELDLDRVRRRLNERLGLAGFTNEVAIDFDIVPRVAADPGTGKIRRVVSEVGEPADLNGAARAGSVGAAREPSEVKLAG